MVRGAERRAVLVVDDDASIRGVVRQALEGEGWRVLEAADGTAALTLSEREGDSVGLVLLDLHMPSMNGAQFAARYWGETGSAVQEEDRAPVVVFTAEGGLEAATQAERLKAVGFVTKPFDLDELLQVVERCARPGAQPASSLPSTDVTTMPAPETPMVSDARGMVSRATSKVTKDELVRQRRMEWLRTQLMQIQRDMGRVRLGVTEVSKVELQRRLTREEARRASQLRMEGERLRYELQLLRDEFYRLKDERRRST